MYFAILQQNYINYSIHILQLFFTFSQLFPILLELQEFPMDNLPEPIELPFIQFDSKTADYILGLEKLRGKGIEGTTPALWFTQLKRAFMLMESVCSSRIEGNHTTVVEYAQKITQQSPAQTVQQKSNEAIQEIANLAQIWHSVLIWQIEKFDICFISYAKPYLVCCLVCLKSWKF